jgi:hypothetical protein
MMTGNDVYIIHWNTFGDSQMVNRFFDDVIKEMNATGGAGTIYSIVYPWYVFPFTRYPALGNIYYTSDPFPPSGCNDGLAFTSVCLTDQQIQGEIEIQRALSGINPLPGGLGSAFFLFLPPGVGVRDPQGQYAFRNFCGYHNIYSSATGAVIYAVIPYSAQPGAGRACDPGERPNLNPFPFPTAGTADPILNIVSHEQAEMLTDPDFTAWHDASGEEIGDKCNFNFGTSQGARGQRYNQVINGDHFYLQTEWVNSIGSCALH